MSSTPHAAPPTAGGAAWPLRRIFVLIVLTEVATMAALYWFGRHFA